MRLKFLVRHRPSASMVVALIALFAALGGVGWAATQLPSGSVGTSQLQNASVTNHKILNGSVGNFKLAFGAVGPRKMENAAVGKNQIDPNAVQARVSGTCSSGAIGSITNAGKVGCVSTPPQEFGTNSATVPVTATGSGPGTSIATKVLPSRSSYLVLAYPHIDISGTSGAVEVDCTLSAGTGSTVTRSLTVDLGTHPQAGTIPLVVTAPSIADPVTASVTCTQVTGSSTVSAIGTINAIQTASNS